MGFRLTIKGNKEEIILEKDRIISIKYISDTNNDANARSTDLSVGFEIVGKITNEKDDISKKICLWSLVPAEIEDAYKQISIEVILAGTVLRKFTLPNSFIVDYIEEYDIKTGTGIFKMKIKQKKEKLENITIEGGYNVQ